MMSDRGRKYDWRGRLEGHVDDWPEVLDEYEAEVERLEKLIEPTEWKGWDQIDTIYEEARLLRHERDAAQAEVERLRAALVRIADGNSGHWGWIAHEALNSKSDDRVRP